MVQTKDIQISDYRYDLPEERIAKYPVAVRDESKLLYYHGGEISESGGAGLGYIDMAKKSGNKIGYRFFDIEELPDYKFFMAYATINRQL